MILTVKQISTFNSKQKKNQERYFSKHLWQQSAPAGVALVPVPCKEMNLEPSPSRENLTKFYLQQLLMGGLQMFLKV